MKILIFGFYDTDISVMIRFLLQIALQEKGRADIIVESAGAAQSCADKSVDHPVIEVLSARGVSLSDLTKYRAQYFENINVQEFAHIFTTSIPLRDLFKSKKGVDALVLKDEQIKLQSPEPSPPPAVVLKSYADIADAIERIIPNILKYIGVED